MGSLLLLNFLVLLSLLGIAQAGEMEQNQTSVFESCLYSAYFAFFFFSFCSISTQQPKKGSYTKQECMVQEQVFTARKFSQCKELLKEQRAVIHFPI